MIVSYYHYIFNEGPPNNHKSTTLYVFIFVWFPILYILCVRLSVRRLSASHADIYVRSTDASHSPKIFKSGRDTLIQPTDVGQQYRDLVIF